jgi:ribosomal-protein-serine acetyltransferase
MGNRHHHPLPPWVIKTSFSVDRQIKMRLIEESDAEELFQLVESSRYSLRQWLPWLDFDRSLEDQKIFIDYSRRKYQQTGAITLTILFEGHIAGVIGMNNIDWPNRSASIGYWLGDSFRGKGIMVRCCEKLLSFSFLEMNLHRVEIKCATNNFSSQKIPESLNLRKEGMLRDAEWLYDRFVNLYLYSALAEEWVPGKGCL